VMKERAARIARNMLLGELGIKWPLNSEEWSLVRDVRRKYTPALDPRHGEWISSRYDRDEFTYARITGGDNGRVWLCRKFERAICVDGSPFAITDKVLFNWYILAASAILITWSFL
jgi:hypothetical protein